MYTKYNNTLSSPTREIFLITPSDTAELPKALRADTGDTLVLRCVDSNTDVTLTVIAGEILPIRPLFVRATGTTATVHGLA